MTLKERAVGFSIDQAYAYLDKNPEENLPKLLDMVKKVVPKGKYDDKIAAFEWAVCNKDNNWHRLILSLWDDIDPEVRKTVFRNFIVNAFFRWSSGKEEREAANGVHIPWTLLIDPTSACNLHCTGCWAAEYGNKLNLDYETLDSLVSQGKELGIYFYLFSGGEPLVRKDDIIKLCGKHDDCVFSAFTNGTLIDEDFADEMLRVKNFIPAISVEGFGEATDSRRGGGTYDKVIKAAHLLHSRKLPFGFSLCYTRANTEVIGSEEFFDWMTGQGAKFAWLFTYMPVGKGAPTDLMVTAEQRKFMYDRVRGYRKTKPVFTVDFWNDGDYVGGCVASGRYYLHINANGDAEPCAFIHYSDSNIHDKSLVEVLKSPLFMQYQSSQPFSENLYRPCPLLDNNGELARMVKASGAISTDLSAPEDVDGLCGKCKEAADKWKPVADGLWEQKRTR